MKAIIAKYVTLQPFPIIGPAAERPKEALHELGGSGSWNRR